MEHPARPDHRLAEERGDAFRAQVTSLGPDENASNPVLQVMFVPFNEDGN